MDVAGFISKHRRSTLVVAGTLLLMLVGIGAYFACGQVLESSIFFIVPISFFTWFVGSDWGLIASGVSAGFTLAANLASPMYPVHPHVAYWNALVWLAFFLLITIIIAELKVLYLRERQLSRVDNLTGIATRLAFYEVAEGEKNRAKRYQHSITIAYLDLDHFKAVNDSMGHAVGDKVLVAVARAIENTIRQTDTVARMGGDEFAIILPNTRKDAAGRVLSKVLRALDEAMLRGAYPVTFSIGAVTFLTPPESLQEMIRQADKVMYSIKSTGKNRLEQKELAAWARRCRPTPDHLVKELGSMMPTASSTSPHVGRVFVDCAISRTFSACQPLAPLVTCLKDLMTCGVFVHLRVGRGVGLGGAAPLPESSDYGQWSFQTLPFLYSPRIS